MSLEVNAGRLNLKRVISQIKLTMLIDEKGLSDIMAYSDISFSSGGHTQI